MIDYNVFNGLIVIRLCDVLVTAQGLYKTLNGLIKIASIKYQ